VTFPARKHAGDAMHRLPFVEEHHPALPCGPGDPRGSYTTREPGGTRPQPVLRSRADEARGRCSLAPARPDDNPLDRCARPQNEDPRLLRGLGSFVDDIETRRSHAACLRAPRAPRRSTRRGPARSRQARLTPRARDDQKCVCGAYVLKRNALDSRDAPGPDQEAATRSGEIEE
jgi:hypothetical protein